ncbi:MAG TPA: TetR/AcrR family transcriptional regulator [Vineibacter sp.]|nr:TetR/AcrR family transcriptional regulator [Vineibacter sp.]
MRRVDPKRQEAQRRRILEAAVACFVRRGFHQTKTAEICAEAGMSPGNVFHYFPNKDAIIEAIVEEDRRETAALFAKLKDADDILKEMLRSLDMLLEVLSDPAATRLGIEVMAEAMRNPKVGALVQRNEAEAKALLVETLERAAARGQVDATLDMNNAAVWLMALVDGAFSRAALEPSFNAQAQAPMLRMMVVRFLRPATSSLPEPPSPKPSPRGGRR